MSVRASFLPLVALAIGCGYTLPEPIYANQVEEYFPEPAEAPGGSEGAEATAIDATAVDATAVDATAPIVVAPDAEAQRAIRVEAERCAARLNEHRSDAEAVGLIQAVLSGFGSLTSGVGGAMSAIDFGNPEITTAMGVMSAASAGVTLIGNLIIGFIANPLEELRLQAQGQRSWELAVELRYAGAEPEAIRLSLVRCTADEGPPVRAVGAGVPFAP